MRVTSTSSLSLPIEVIRTAADLNPLQTWSRGDGASGIDIRSASSGTFTPTLAAYNTNAGSNFSIYSYGKADLGAGAAINMRAGNVTNAGVITGGTVLRVSNWTTQLLNIDYAGVTTLSNLAGTGTRVVTASSTGVLSTMPAPLSGTYNVTATSVGANAQVTLGTVTISGAVVGDVVHVTQPASALFYKARVTGANTVTIYALNPTGGGITTTAETINVRVIK